MVARANGPALCHAARRGPRAVRAALWAAPFALLAVLSLSTAGAAPAILPNGVTTFSAPFSGHVRPWTDDGRSGCARLTVTDRPHLQLSTGQGGLGLITGAKSCAASYDGGGYESESLAEMGFTILLPLRPSTNGTAVVTANLTFRASWNETLQHAGCARSSFVSRYCVQYASVYLEVVPYVIDVTTSTFYYWSSTYWSHAYPIDNESLDMYACGSSGCTSTVTGSNASLSATFHDKLPVSVPFVTTDRYQLEIDIQAVAESEILADRTSILGHARATAEENLGTGPNYIRLDNVTIG